MGSYVVGTEFDAPVEFGVWLNLISAWE